MPNNDLDDLLNHSESAFTDMDAKRYQAEEVLAEKYRSFVTEILKLSLAGVAVFSYIYKDKMPGENGVSLRDVLALSGIGMFAVSVACALIFLFCSSEGLRWYIAGLRCKSTPLDSIAGGCKEEKEQNKQKMIKKFLEERGNWINRCRWSKGLATLLLGLGSISVALAMLPLTRSPTLESTPCQNPSGEKLEDVLCKLCATRILKN